MRTRLRRAGFTLVEVMLALAILGVALVLLVKSVAGNITTAAEAFYMGVSTDLARGKMYDIEEEIIQEGFQETEQALEGDFSEEGWPTITWKATIVPTELPSYDALMGIQQGAEGGEGAGTGSGSGAESQADKFSNSAVGTMANMFGGGGGGTSAEGDEASTGSFIQGYYTMIQQILKASIRKINLTVSYDTALRKEHFDVVLYVVDTAGMAKTLGPMWKQ